MVKKIKDRPLMRNILPLTMRRENTAIVFLLKYLYGSYDANDFVSFSLMMVVTRMILDF